MKPRPTNINNCEVWKRAALDIKVVLSGCPAVKGLSDGNYEAIKDAFEVMANFKDTEAFEIAKRLDHECGWPISSGDVVQLEDVESQLIDAHKQLVRKWVSENGIETPFARGDTVKFERHGETRIGKVDQVMKPTAQIAVRVDWSSTMPIVNVEDVELIASANDNQVNYNDFKWLLNCAMAGIEEAYELGAPRRIEMQKLTGRLRECARRLEPIIVLHDESLDDDLEKESEK